jgi:hypothetical protein
VTHGRAKGGEGKRTAIVETLAGLLAKGEGKGTLTEAGKGHAERGKEYAEPPRRKAMLGRRASPPAKNAGCA